MFDIFCAHRCQNDGELIAKMQQQQKKHSEGKLVCHFGKKKSPSKIYSNFSTVHCNK